MKKIRTQTILVVGMIMMAGMFAVTVVEDICDTLAEKINDL